MVPPLCASTAFGVGQQLGADTAALRVGQHGETRDHVPSRLIGMVGIRIESACRHGPIPVERQQMNGHGIPLVEFRPPVTLADEHLLAYRTSRFKQMVVGFDFTGHGRQCSACHTSCRARHRVDAYRHSRPAHSRSR